MPAEVSTLVLVRHGQTDGPLRDRDRLSELGLAQGEAVGETFGDLPIDRLFVGPRRRHRQTLEAARRPHWPEALELETLDEFPAEKLLRETATGTEYTALDTLGRLWARGEHAEESLESWSAFETRVRGALAELTSDAPKGSVRVAFTSGGVIGCAVGAMLGLPSERSFELGLVVRNASRTELVFTRGRVSLLSFNVPLPDATLHTWR